MSAARRLSVFPFLKLSMLNRHGRMIATHPQALCATSSLALAAGHFSSLLQKRTKASVSSRVEPPSRPYRNLRDVRSHLCPPDQHSRTVLCIKVPTFAIHDDVHELFEEAGFDVSVIASVVLFNVVPDFPKATCYNAV